MKILLVDDDRYHLNNVEAKLSMMFLFAKNVEFIKVYSFEEAKDKLAIEKMDVIFLDGYLNNSKFGWELDPYIKNKPIIYFLTDEYPTGVKIIPESHGMTKRQFLDPKNEFLDEESFLAAFQPLINAGARINYQEKYY